MKRTAILALLSIAFLVSRAWGQTVAGSLSNDNSQGDQNAPCGTGCLCSPPGLIGWWAGDGNAQDTQGVGPPCLKSYHGPSNGILMKGAKFAWGLIGPAFTFDGVDDYVDVPDTPTLHQVTTAVTVEAWINPQPSPDFSGGSMTPEGYILARRDPLQSEGFHISVNNDGYLVQSTSTDVLTGLASADPVIQFNGEWKHVAFTADSSTGQVFLYLNGKPLVLQLVNGSPNPSGKFADVSHLFIGQRQGSDTPEGPALACHYKALIDEVGLYNRALTAAEIQAIYRVGRKGRCKASMEMSSR